MPSLPPDFMARMRAADPSLWSQDSDDEITNRLGWLDLPETSRPHLDSWRDLAAPGAFDRVLLLGMGGSSLAPETFARTFGSAPGYPTLEVLDSTHPGAVRAAAAGLDLEGTLFVVSSKSGTTLETLSLFHFFWEQAAGIRSDPGSAFVAITDPGTPLAQLAENRGFRAVVLADPDVGGRFSALTAFGLVPAALIGADLDALLDSAAAALQEPVLGEALQLGTILGEGAAAGNDKATVRLPAPLAPLGAWLEQLIAESTGKDGTGIVPVVDEPRADLDRLGPGRVVVGYGTTDGGIHIEASPADLGREMMRWEIATAAAGAVLGVHPFNQPDVEVAKDLARRAMAGERIGSAADEVPADDPRLGKAAATWAGSVRAEDYVAVQAFVAPDPAVAAGVRRLRESFLRRGGTATTFGYGPRFLHSTGQLHKGGADNGVFLQIIDHGGADVPVPEADHTFFRLITAQAIGDHTALTQAGRRVLQVCLGDDPHGGIDTLADAIEAGLH